MRSLPLKAAIAVILVTGAWACGDDNGGVGPGDNPPVASFTAPTNCVPATPCSFTSTSTDDKGITAYSWNFGDQTPADPNQNPTHTFAAAGTYTVSLTVTDASNQSNVASHDVVVGGGTTNQPPVASFTAPACTVNVACAFTDASTDADGTIATWSWNFGDGTALDPNQSPSHTFGAEGTYQVTLTVTDNGGATNSITQPVTVSGAAAQNCTVSGTTIVSCTLAVAQRSTVSVTLTSRECEIGGNRVSMSQPRSQNLWFNVCSQTAGSVQTLRDASGAPLVIEAGQSFTIQFSQGTVDPGDPIPGPPAANVTGTAPTWTINIDDGGNPSGLNEPDFTDVVLTVQATAAP